MTGDARLLLIIGLPLAGVVFSALPWLMSRRDTLSPYLRFWLDAFSLALVCAGILGAGMLALFTPAEADATILGARLTMSPLVKVALAALCGALVLPILFTWDEGRRASGPYLLAWASGGVGALLAGGMLAAGRATQGLLLFGVALIIAAATLERLPTLSEVESGGERRRFAARLAGGLKHLALAATGTTLLLLGALALSQHSLNLENRALLQLGVGMLAVGLMLRVGAMPFAGAYGDLARTSPGLAILALGVAVPGTLVVGLLMLAPVESGSVSAQSTGWLGALATLLAGLRALGAGSISYSGNTHGNQDSESHLPTLLTMTVATQMGWALAGVLSGSRMGVTGAVLLIISMAFAVPLLLASSHERGGRLSGIVRAVGIASLLGLPPLGGSLGTLMLAQAAANHNGWWLAVLLLGTLLTGAGWLRSGILKAQNVTPAGNTEQNASAATPHDIEWNAATLIIITLVIVQVALFLSSGLIANILASWTNIPWLGTP